MRLASASRQAPAGRREPPQATRRKACQPLSELASDLLRVPFSPRDSFQKRRAARIRLRQSSSCGAEIRRGWRRAAWGRLRGCGGARGPKFARVFRAARRSKFAPFFAGFLWLLVKEFEFKFRAFLAGSWLQSAYIEQGQPGVFNGAIANNCGGLVFLGP